MPIAAPIPRALFTALGYPWLTHITRQTSLLGSGGSDGIVKSVTGRSGEWTDCTVDLVGSSGFGGGGRRLFRDYSVLDFEMKLQNRGSYTYFFAGEPSGWGLLKNLGTGDLAALIDDGFAVIRVATADVLARYDGPLFWRLDDKAVVIRGGYAGPARVMPLPMR